MPISTPAARLLLFCEHPILAFGLEAILQGEEDFSFELTKSKDEALAVLRGSAPEILLLDMNSDFNLGFLKKLEEPEHLAK